MNKKNKILPIIIFSILLNSCTNNDWENIIKKDITKNNTEIKWENNEIKNNKESNNWQLKINESFLKKLKINDKCIWCWRCTMTDPIHFKINLNTFRPDIISQKDLNWNATQSAIKNCPASAISIS
jgi:ferredoxin